ncbi:MAG: adenylosuccinate lyase [Acidobacteriota bacterium]|nr:adenylosuccinate lyase [Blastocatellia bacterium]MDW8411984.1 adenylosuccinate lyase [Acidobacteriota bacterium]
MIPRYTLPEMGKLWSEETKFQKWLEVELAVCDVHAEMGTIPKDAAQAIRKNARFNVERIRELEASIKHDVIAFTSCVAESIGNHSRYFHYGLTSSDVVDTANALLLKEAADIILNKAYALLETLKRRAFEFKETVMVGRTHGIHAEPTTFGLVLALYYAEIDRNIERIKSARRTVSYGKLSGAVGTFAHISPEVEDRVCARLGLRPEPVSTQVVQRDRYAEFLAALAITAASCEKIALEVRHLQRTEVSEAQEEFTEGQKGSSAMPHKRNPIISEQICGLARIVRSNLQAALENIALWHERDISHSSVERVILPDSCILTDYLLTKTEHLIDRLKIFPDRMLKNLYATQGLVFSGKLLLELTNAGLSREDAYRLVQRNAMRSWDEKADFKQLVVSDPDISAVISEQKLEKVFDLRAQLQNIDKVFNRVFQCPR